MSIRLARGQVAMQTRFFLPYLRFTRFLRPKLSSFLLASERVCRSTGANGGRLADSGAIVWVSLAGEWAGID